jgi:DNA-directed RNA polymerase subunit H (RpoH/RPB5)
VNAINSGNFLLYSRLKYGEVENMVKKAVIAISLVDESAEVANEEIEKEILNELSKEPTRIPWLKEVKKVTVTEE